MTALLAILTRWRPALPFVAGLALLASLMHYRTAYRTERAGRLADRAAYTAAQDEAGRIARAALAHQEATYRAKAQDTDHAYNLALADARSAADRFIAAHRLRDATLARPTGPAAAGTTGSNPGLPASLPVDAVMVSAGDVRACTDATAYALKAHDWAASLTQP